MKNRALTFGLAAFSLIALAIGCSKPETVTPPPSSEVSKMPVQPAADALRDADAQKAADALKAADAQKQAEATALKQAEADKADQALKQAIADKAAGDKLVADQAAAAKQVQPGAGDKNVQALIDTAKRLSGENKWAEVLKILSELASQKLSPAQQVAVDGLKADAQKQAGAAVATQATTEAGNALGGLLPPKK